MDLYSQREGKGGYLAFIGRISPEKRPDRAIQLAIQTGIPLKIAAKVDNVDRKYYEEKIKPMMDHPLEWKKLDGHTIVKPIKNVTGWKYGLYKGRLICLFLSFNIFLLNSEYY